MRSTRKVCRDVFFPLLGRTLFIFPPWSRISARDTAFAEPKSVFHSALLSEARPHQLKETAYIFRWNGIIQFVLETAYIFLETALSVIRLVADERSSFAKSVKVNTHPDRAWKSLLWRFGVARMRVIVLECGNARTFWFASQVEKSEERAPHYCQCLAFWVQTASRAVVLQDKWQAAIHSDCLVNSWAVPILRDKK